MARARITKTAVSRLFDAAATPIYVVDERRTLIYCNPALANWLGMPREELLGGRCDYGMGVEQDATHKALAGLCPPPDSFAGRQTSAAAFAPPRDGVVARRRADFVPLRDVGGKLLGVVATLEALDAAAAGQGPETSEATVPPVHWHELVHAVRARLGKQFQLEQLVGVSAAARRVQQQIRLAATGSSRVVVYGPPGSGRERVARTIHFAGAGFDSAALVPLACPLLDAELLETTVRAFVQRVAELETEQPPTLLLLDVDRLPLDAQAELEGLLAIEELGLRSLASSRVSLFELVERSEFRSDLAHSMSVLEMALPGLTQRREDIPLLAQWFVEQFNAEGGPRQIAGFESTALEQLITYPWPRNVDELKEVVAETIRRSQGPLLRCEDLPRQIWLGLDAVTHPTREAGNIPLEELLQRVERQMITSALAHTKGNKAEAARRLGVTRQRLLRRIAQLGLAHDDAN